MCEEQLHLLKILQEVKCRNELVQLYKNGLVSNALKSFSLNKNCKEVLLKGKLKLNLAVKGKCTSHIKKRVYFQPNLFRTFR